nr:hypothetical protein [Tanacetum cinerariifolium]
YAMPKEIEVSLILNSLNKDYDQFVQNYNMHSMRKSIVELHAMLKLHEKGIPKKAETLVVLAIHEAHIPPPKRDNPAKDFVCHHYKEVGHWKRNCPFYQAELKKRKNASIANTSGYAMPKEIEVSLILNSLNKDYDQFVQNYNMHSMRKSIVELHAMLKLHEKVVEAIGSFDLVLPCGLIIVLDNCHFAPTITKGVVSVSHLVNSGYIHRFMNYGISVLKDNVFYFNAIPHHGIYGIDMHNFYPNVSSMFNVSNKRANHALDSSYLWHCRLGHINKKHMDKLQRDGILQLTHDESLEKCKSCIFEKMVCKLFSHQVERAKDLLGLTHTDVCDPFRTMSREGASYFITFIDDFICYGYVYLMDHKHEVFEIFKVFQNEVENQLGKKIKVIRSDRRGEYLSHEFVNHMKSYGIVSQLTPPYTPQHNRMSERRNQTLLDVVRSMMNLTTLPKSFWRYTLESVVCILNMVPTKKVERTPYEIWHVKAPKLSYLRVWGYPKETMGYYFYYPLENKIVVARNVEFFENSLMVQEAMGSHGLLESSGSDEGLELIQEEDAQPSENTNEVQNEVAPIEVGPQNVEVHIRRFTRIPQAPDRYCFYVDVEEYELRDLNEPPNYTAALVDPKTDKWLEAMNIEMQSIKDNQVWVLVELPPNGQTIRSKWLFKKQSDMDGKVHTFKARLVEKGYTQTYCVDYKEALSPVVDIRAIRILLAIAAFYDYEIWQMDIKTAFLNSHLSKDVYIVQPEGFVDPKHPNKVCKLQCFIYSLKQASRSWNKRFDVEIKNIGFTQNPDEPCVYLKASGSNVAFLILYVDDILLIGINVSMFQSAYLEKTLKKLRMKNSNKGYTPMIEKPDYRKSQGAQTPSEKSAKQSTTAMSSIEAEYIVAVEASMEAVWMRKFIDGLGDVVRSNKRPMEMLCYNEPAIAIANDPEILKGARHFQSKYHYIREVIQECEIVLKKVHTYNNIAGPFTKPMSFNKHSEHAMAIGIFPANYYTRACTRSVFDSTLAWLLETKVTTARLKLKLFSDAAAAAHMNKLVIANDHAKGPTSKPNEHGEASTSEAAKSGVNSQPKNDVDNVPLKNTFDVVKDTYASKDVVSIMDDSFGDSEEVENVFVDDNRKPMDDLVYDAWKKVEAPPKKTPRKTSIWSGKKEDSPKRKVVFSPEPKIHYFGRDNEEVENENAYSKNG